MMLITVSTWQRLARLVQVLDNVEPSSSHVQINLTIEAQDK